METEIRQKLLSYAKLEANTIKDFMKYNKEVKKPIRNRYKQVITVSDIPIIRKGLEIDVLLHPFRLQKNGASPLHKHTYFEMGFVFKGSCTSISDGHITKLNEGDVFIVNRNVLHQLKTDTIDDYVFNIVISLSAFNDQFLNMISHDNPVKNFFVNSILDNQEKSCLVFRRDQENEASFFILKLIYECIKFGYTDNNYIRLLLACIFRELSSKYQKETDERSKTKDREMTISKVLDYLAENYATVTLKSTAEYFHYSTRYITTFISKYTGKSFSYIVREFKLQNAIYMALYTKLSFADIANSVGYSERGYLDRTLKTHTGKTLSEHRKQNDSDDFLFADKDI